MSASDYIEYGNIEEVSEYKTDDKISLARVLDNKVRLIKLKNIFKLTDFRGIVEPITRIFDKDTKGITNKIYYPTTGNDESFYKEVYEFIEDDDVLNTLTKIIRRADLGSSQYATMLEYILEGGVGASLQFWHDGVVFSPNIGTSFRLGSDEWDSGLRTIYYDKSNNKKFIHEDNISSVLSSLTPQPIPTYKVLQTSEFLVSDTVLNDISPLNFDFQVGKMYEFQIAMRAKQDVAAGSGGLKYQVTEETTDDIVVSMQGDVRLNSSGFPSTNKPIKKDEVRTMLTYGDSPQIGFINGVCHIPSSAGSGTRKLKLQIAQDVSNVTWLEFEKGSFFRARLIGNAPP